MEDFLNYVLYRQHRLGDWGRGPDPLHRAALHSQGDGFPVLLQLCLLRCSLPELYYGKQMGQDQSNHHFVHHFRFSTMNYQMVRLYIPTYGKFLLCR
jgi:hypothetical protein